MGELSLWKSCPEKTVLGKFTGQHNRPDSNHNRVVPDSFFLSCMLPNFISSDAEQNREAFCRQLLFTVLYGISKNIFSWKLLIFEAWCIKKCLFFIL